MENNLNFSIKKAIVFVTDIKVEKEREDAPNALTDKLIETKKEWKRLGLVKKYSLHITKFGIDVTTTSANVITYGATISDFGPSSKGGPAKYLHTRFVLMWEEKN
jgi:hypothetical protein